MTFDEDDLDRLADYAAGLLDPAEAASVAARVATDPHWAAVYGQLVTADVVVATQLRDAPGEDVMPADIVARLDAAFAGEAAAGDAGSDAAARTPVISLAEARRRRQRRAGLVAVGAVAAAVVAVVGGSVVNGGLPVREFGSAADAPAMGTGAGADNGAPEAANSDKSVSDGPGATAPASAQALSAGQLATVPITDSDTDYTWTSLPLAAAGVTLTDGNSSTAKSTARARVPRALRDLARPETLRACLEAVGVATGGTPTRAEFASYDGTPALVVVITRPAGKTVAAVGGDCGPGSPDLRARRDLP
ncbi:hypothetical protein GCM10009682_10790 [Luedemannella flava]|uniref:Uncharacterized protein n=1 Tax=Luedemannella flava TaxID=349316 RepID=A0ABN2LKC1_9ACTN